jgi:hypothetical protein
MNVGEQMSNCFNKVFSAASSIFSQCQDECRLITKPDKKRLWKSLQVGREMLATICEDFDWSKIGWGESFAGV